MTEHKFQIDNIPTVVYGEASDKAYLFVHGQGGCKEEGAAFAQIVCPVGFQVLAVDLPQHGARQQETEGFDPWTAAEELKRVYAYMSSRWSKISLRANSIGAHFSMLALSGVKLQRALFVSPIVDMERLIIDMLLWAGVDEEELQAKGEIATDFGQTLSWHYLTWERQLPALDWHCPTVVLYAGGDNMTSRETVERYVSIHNATLTVMEDGEHWFHTKTQLAVLQKWEAENIL